MLQKEMSLNLLGVRCMGTIMKCSILSVLSGDIMVWRDSMKGIGQQLLVEKWIFLAQVGVSKIYISMCTFLEAWIYVHGTGRFLCKKADTILHMFSMGNQMFLWIVQSCIFFLHSLLNIWIISSNRHCNPLPMIFLFLRQAKPRSNGLRSETNLKHIENQETEMRRSI